MNADLPAVKRWFMEVPMSNTGTGIVAETALNCYGRADSGDGIYATVATNCVGYVYNNSAANIALSAITANGCRGSGANAGTGSTISQSITNKYNMP